MSTTHRVATALLTVFAASSITIGLATTPALAATASGEVIASDSTTVVAASNDTATAPRTGVSAAATAPREISVVGHGGKPVTLSAKGMPTKRIPRPGNAPATFTGLSAGKSYIVRVAGKKIGNVVALDAPAAATGLKVSTTDQPTAVALNWDHQTSAATGGKNVQFTVTASSPTAKTVTAKVSSSHAAILPGLDANALYTFSVTPLNSAGTGKPTQAVMTRSLASIKGAGVPAPTTPESTVDSATIPVKAAPPAPASPAPSAAPAPSTPPGPRTTTIYVCPDGFAMAGDLCQQVRNYTYHDVTETQPYTYYPVFVETSRTWRSYPTDWSGTTCPYGGTMHGGECVGWDIQGYTTSAKNSPPAGWQDDGSSYVRTTRVMDETPAGFTDDGTQWVKTAPKEARTVTV